MAIFKIFVIDFKNGRKKKTPQKMQTNEGGENTYISPNPPEAWKWFHGNSILSGLHILGGVKTETRQTSL